MMKCKKNYIFTFAFPVCDSFEHNFHHNLWKKKFTTTLRAIKYKIVNFSIIAVSDFITAWKRNLWFYFWKDT